jgi:hypothetical protein
VDTRSVDRELRATIWPAMRKQGFNARASRIAWRYATGVELVEISSVGRYWDELGCTPFSLTARVGAIPRFVRPRLRIPERNGQLRPRYWHCDPLHWGIRKTLSQPWFHPFAQSPQPNVLPGIARHREGMMKVLRRDVHDRPDVWFVREDGSNLGEVISDLLAVIEGEGLAMLQQFSNPEAVIGLVQSGKLICRPESPVAKELVGQARAYLRNFG